MNSSLLFALAAFVQTLRLHHHGPRPVRGRSEPAPRPPALRELAVLGFIRVMRRGVAGNAEFRQPALYRLTFFPTKDAPATHDWRAIAAVEDADQVAKAARSNVDPKAVARGKKQKPAPGFRSISTPVSGGETAHVPPPVSGVTEAPPVSGLLSRSRAGGPKEHGDADPPETA